MGIFRTSCGTQFVVDDKDDAHVRGKKWYVARDGHCLYIQRGVSAKESGGIATTIGLHRQLLDAPRGMSIDHINGDGTDNRRDNLRVCSAAENAANARLSSRNKTGVKGLTMQKRNGRVVWVAEVLSKGQRFRAPRARREDAEAWLRIMRPKVHGEFARFA